MISNSDNLSQQLSNTDMIKTSVKDDELYGKLKQLKEVTDCNEEHGLLILHDCNYNVEQAINTILTLDSKNEFEWKTKKVRQRKLQLKTKETDKSDINNNSKDKIFKKPNPLYEGTCVRQLTQDSYINGRTFRNYNLPKKVVSEYVIKENLNAEFKSTLMNSNGKWNGKSIIIENGSFSPMANSEISIIIEVKNKSFEKPIEVTSDIKVTKGENITDSSITFKTHCSTKPPPKVQYSLEIPVQIMNKNVRHRYLPKLKFGDTDFSENSQIHSSEIQSNVRSPIKDRISESVVINVEDNSIIKVGPSQKPIIDQSSPTVPIQSNYSSYFPPKSEYAKCNTAESYYDSNYGYLNIHNQLPIGNSLSCNAGYSPVASYPPHPHINKDPGNHSKTHDIFLNQPQPNTYVSQSNMNHPKSTIYLLPNMMMQNPMNTLYMTVANPLPTSALSSHMASIPSPYNIPHPSQHDQMHFDETHQTLDTVNRQFNKNRQQPINRMKKSYGDLSEDLTIKSDIVKNNLKKQNNFPMNPNQLSKQIPLNYSLYISPGSVAAPNRAQLFSNTISPFNNNFHTQQELSGFDNNNRKRNMPMSSNSFSGKQWS